MLRIFSLLNTVARIAHAGSHFLTDSRESEGYAAFWFGDHRGDGVRFRNEFSPIPYETVALVLTAVRTSTLSAQGNP